MNQTPATPLLRPLGRCLSPLVRFRPAPARCAGAGLALALLAFAGLLATPTAAQAQTTLVSNFGQGTDSNTQFSRDMSQPFTTGSTSGGYSLGSVSIKTDLSAGRSFAMAVCDVDADNHPTSSCTALTAPSAFPSGAQTLVFTASTAIALDANKTYTLFISGASGTIKYVMTAADGEDSGGAAGWSLADNAEFKNASDVWTDVSSGKSLRVTIFAPVSGTAATGKPGISGAPQRGETLTATIGDIEDDDGITTRTFPDDFTFQWAKDGSDITGATDDTYDVPAATALDSTFTVKVWFNDDDDNSEGPLESDATSGTIDAKEDCATDRADSDWCDTMTVGSLLLAPLTTGYGYFVNQFGSLDDTSIRYGGETWTVQEAYFSDSFSDSFIIQLQADVPLGSTFDLGGTTLTADANSEQSTSGRYIWSTTTNPGWIVDQKVTVSANLAPIVTAAAVSGDTLVLTFAEDLDTGSEPDPSAFTVAADGTAVTVDDVDMSGDTVTLTLASSVTSGQAVTVAYAPPSMNPLQDESGTDAPAFAAGDFTVRNDTGNNVATGKPGITGAAQRGETLTATLGTIEDDDGLTTKTFPDDFTFQWEMGGSDIDGATSSTYDVPAATALGSTFTVKVSFSDDGGNSEGPLESDATAGTIEARGDCPTGNDWCTAMTVEVAAPQPSQAERLQLG